MAVSPLAGQSRHAIDHVDVERPEWVTAVGHSGGSHRVGDQRDLMRTDKIEHRRHRLVGQMYSVPDQLDHHLSFRSRGKTCRHCAGSTVMHRSHTVEQVSGTERCMRRVCDRTCRNRVGRIGVSDTHDGTVTLQQ